MPRYRYTYLNAKERRKQDWIEALHLQEAREKLAQQGVQLLSIREVPPRRVRLKNSELIIFSRQMLLLLRSGLPLYETLSSLRDQYQGQALSGLLTVFMETFVEEDHCHRQWQCIQGFLTIFIAVLFLLEKV